VLDFTQGHSKGLSYYGHLQFLKFDSDGVHLGAAPKDPVNTYRSGEKLVLDGGNVSDFEATTTLSFVKGNRDAGLLFRVTRPSVGFDAQSGYFAGLIPRDKVVVLGKTDGTRWTEISRAPVPFDPKAELKFGVAASGPEIKISLDGKTILTAKDTTYPSGSVGLRVVDTHARFGKIEVKAPAN
jgi:hypothetical protein